MSWSRSPPSTPRCRRASSCSSEATRVRAASNSTASGSPPTKAESPRGRGSSGPPRIRSRAETEGGSSRESSSTADAKGWRRREVPSSRSRLCSASQRTSSASAEGSICSRLSSTSRGLRWRSTSSKEPTRQSSAEATAFATSSSDRHSAQPTKTPPWVRARRVFPIPPVPTSRRPESRHAASQRSSEARPTRSGSSCRSSR